MYAVSEYIPTSPDELHLQIGDEVLCQSQFRGGWAQVGVSVVAPPYNLADLVPSNGSTHVTSGQFGMFPLSITSPNTPLRSTAYRDYQPRAPLMHTESISPSLVPDFASPRHAAPPPLQSRPALPPWAHVLRATGEHRYPMGNDERRPWGGGETAGMREAQNWGPVPAAVGPSAWLGT